MGRGEFDVQIPVGGEDDVARLGAALLDLAQTLESRFEEAAHLAQITEKVNAGLLLDEVLDHVFESFRPLIPYDRIGLAVLQDDGQVVRARWARSDAPVIKLPVGFMAMMEGSSLRTILRSGEPRILNDLEAYFEDHPHSESTRRIVAEGMRSSLTCPLVALGKPFGFLFFSSRERDTYRDVHQGIFQKIAGQLSVILEKSRLYSELVELNHQLVEARTALEFQATHDPLTEAWNRGAILKLLHKELLLSQREGRPLAVVLADVDHFKKINDAYGHQVGDVVLRQVTRRIASGLRGSDSFGRYGGEEFLMVLYPCDAGAAHHAAERIRLAVDSSAVETAGGAVRASVSLGAAVCDLTDGVEADALIRAADRALYEAKDAGRNRAVIRLLAAN